VNDMSDSGHRATHNIAVRNAPIHDIQLLMGFQTSVVAECANSHILTVACIEDTADEMSPYFPRSAGNQDVSHAFFPLTAPFPLHL